MVQGDKEMQMLYKEVENILGIKNYIRYIFVLQYLDGMKKWTVCKISSVHTKIRKTVSV